MGLLVMPKYLVFFSSVAVLLPNFSRVFGCLLKDCIPSLCCSWCAIGYKWKLSVLFLGNALSTPIDLSVSGFSDRLSAEMLAIWTPRWNLQVEDCRKMGGREGAWRKREFNLNFVELLHIGFLMCSHSTAVMVYWPLLFADQRHFTLHGPSRWPQSNRGENKVKDISNAL